MLVSARFYLFDVPLEELLIVGATDANFNEPVEDELYEISSEVAADAQLLSVDVTTVGLTQPVTDLLLEACLLFFVFDLDRPDQLEDEAAQVYHVPAALHVIPVKSFNLSFALSILPQVIVAPVEVTMD